MAEQDDPVVERLIAHMGVLPLSDLRLEEIRKAALEARDDGSGQLALPAREIVSMVIELRRFRKDG